MQKSTTSPSVCIYSTDNDCIASQHITIQKTPACTYTIHCVRHDCPAVFVYGNGINWPTVNCLVDTILSVQGNSMGSLLAPSHSHTLDGHSSQHAPSPPQLTPESCGIDNEFMASYLSGAANVRRQSALTSVPGTILDCGSSTGESALASLRWR
ncbi:hypothetical protein BDR04DRAFT_1092384 [Suillus decipiens]|nr:hypothetical protein BDR04DRAFT_1092384 [Suillus decipiens]